MWDQIDDIVQVDLNERVWTVEVDQAVVIRLGLTNRGSKANLFRIELLGLNFDWVSLSATAIHLAAGEQVPVVLSIMPTKHSTTTAGPHNFWIQVTSPDDPNRLGRYQATLYIKPYFSFALNDVWPRQQKLSWFRPNGRVAGALVNQSNTEAAFQIDGAASPQNCQFEFRSSLEDISLANRFELRLAPGQSVAVAVTITPHHRQLISLRRETYFCTITARLLNQPQVPRSVLVQLRTEPFIGPGWLACFVIGLALLLSFVLPPQLKNYFDSAPATKGNMASSEPQNAGKGQRYDGRIIVVGERSESVPFNPTDTGYMTYEEIFKEIALEYNLDWRILAEQAYWESRLDPMAIGARQEMGLMQIYPTTWQEWSQKLDVTDPFDPYSNARVGAAYLAFLRDYFNSLGHSEEYWMLVAYNWGPDNLNKLLSTSGDWLQVPVRTRQYSLGILEAARAGTMSTALLEQLQQQVWVEKGHE